MRIRTAFALVSALAISAFAAADKILTIGDNAPEFKVAGFVKGEKIGKIEKGKTYVVEFWATWCGPCIQQMPHLSEMAEKFKDKVNVVSVNCYDCRTKDPKVKEDFDVHTKRVSEWVKNNDKNMRYNIVLDDQNDTIGKNWMTPAGQNGIPCAFIVNDEGKIAWIGHPANMEDPLTQVSNHTWDLQAFKTKFDAGMAAQRAADEARAKLAMQVKAGDQAAVDAYIDGSKNKMQGFFDIINAGLQANPEFVYQNIVKYEPKIAIPGATWCSLAGALAPNLKGDSKAGMLKISEKYANAADPKVAALIYAYHARALATSGDKDAAGPWVEKAKAALDTYEPATRKDAIGKMIEEVAKLLKGN